MRSRKWRREGFGKYWSCGKKSRRVGGRYNDIYEILRSDGIEIPKNRQIIVLEPFMKRNGYRNGNGWWIKV